MDAFDWSPDWQGLRLEQVVVRCTGLSRRKARILLRLGGVFVAGRPCKISAKAMPAGASLALDPALLKQARSDGPEGADSQGEQRGAPRPKILHLERHWVVVNKPAQLLSEPDRSDGPSVLSWMPQLLEQAGERHPKRQRVWLVHRLDAGTSGAMVLARSKTAAAALGDAFATCRVRKRYVALCAGRFETQTVCDGPILRVRGVRHGVGAKGRPACTEIEPLAVGGLAKMGREVSLVAAYPKTGRTHQIRVHMAHLGYPLLGDRLYGGPGYTDGESPRPIGRAMLHAETLDVPLLGSDGRLQDPDKDARYPTRVAPPADFQSLCAAYGL